MKKVLLLSILFLLSICLQGQVLTNVLTGTVGDYGLRNPSNVTVTLTLISPNPRTINNILIRQDPTNTVTDTGGAFAFTNIQWGKYLLTLSGRNGTEFLAYVGTNTSNTVPIASLITNSGNLPPNPASNYYTQAQVNALIAAIPTNGGGSIGASNINGSVQGVGVTNIGGTNYVVSTNIPNPITNNNAAAVTLQSTITSQQQIVTNTTPFKGYFAGLFEGGQNDDALLSWSYGGTEQWQEHVTNNDWKVLQFQSNYWFDLSNNGVFSVDGVSIANSSGLIGAGSNYSAGTNVVFGVGNTVNVASNPVFGSVTASSFTGNGATLTNYPASAINNATGNPASLTNSANVFNGTFNGSIAGVTNAGQSVNPFLNIPYLQNPNSRNREMQLYAIPIIATNLNAIGDSWMYGSLASSPSTLGFAALIAASNNLPLNNYGASGTCAADQWNGISNSIYYTPGSFALFNSGINDVIRDSPTAPVYLAGFTGVMLGYLTMLESGTNFIAGTNFAVLAGSWSNATTYFGANPSVPTFGLITTNAGALSNSVSGKTVIIEAMNFGGNTGTGGAFSVWIDGVNHGTNWLTNTFASISSLAWCPTAFYYPNLAEAVHSVVISNVGPAGTYVDIEYLTSPEISLPAAPLVEVFNIPPQTNYSTGPGGSALSVQLYNQQIQYVCDLMDYVGYPIAQIDTFDIVTEGRGTNFYNTNFYGDVVHLTNAGHAYLAAAACRQISRSPVNIKYNDVGMSIHTFGGNYLVFDESAATSSYPCVGILGTGGQLVFLVKPNGSGYAGWNGSTEPFWWTASGAVTALSYTGNGVGLTNLGLARTNTVWVAPNGNNTNQGTSVNFPLANVGAAVTLLTTLGGGKINVEAGTYTEVDAIHLNNISIEGAGIGATTIQSPMLTNNLFYADSGTCWFGRFTIQSTVPAAAGWAAFHVGSSSNAQVTFNQMVVTNAVCAVDTHTGSTAQFSLLIDDCQFYTTNSTASIQLSTHQAGTNSPCTIQNCIISNFLSTASTNTCCAILNQSCDLTLNNCQLFAVNPSTGGSWSLLSGANGGSTIASNWVSGNIYGAPIGLVYQSPAVAVYLYVSNNINPLIISNFNGTVFYDGAGFSSLQIGGVPINPVGATDGQGLYYSSASSAYVPSNNPSSGGGFTGNVNQFSSGGGTTNIIAGALITNATFQGAGANSSGITVTNTGIPKIAFNVPTNKVGVFTTFIAGVQTWLTSWGQTGWSNVDLNTSFGIYDDVNGNFKADGTITGGSIYGNNQSGQSVVVTSSGQLGVGTNGGASQTPWTSTINAGSYSLTNLTQTVYTTTNSGSTPEMVVSNASANAASTIQYNFPSGTNGSWAIQMNAGGSQQMLLQAFFNQWNFNQFAFIWSNGLVQSAYGFAGSSSWTNTVAATGWTNTNSFTVVIQGMEGTSVTWTNQTSHNKISLGTISVGESQLLKPTEGVFGTGMSGVIEQAP